MYLLLRVLLYHIPCGCKGSYYGETKRKLSTCSREHELACKQAKETGIVRKNGYNDAGMATHCLSCSKSFNFSEIKILERRKNSDKQQYLEAMHILLASDSLNLNQGKKTIDPNWLPILKAFQF